MSTQNRLKSFHSAFVIFSGVIIMLCLGTVYSWSIFRLPIEEKFSIGATLSGLPYMTALAFYALSMMLTGRVLNKFNPVILIWIGSAFVATGWILSAYADNITQLTLTYGILSGTGVGIIYGVPITVTAKWFPHRRGFAVGLVLLGFGLSPLITAPIAKRLLDLYSVSQTFLFLGIAFGVIIPLFALALRYPTHHSTNALNTAATKTDLTSTQMIRSKSFVGLYINFVIGALIGLTVVGITSTIGVKYFMLTASQVAVAIPIFAIFNGLGRPLFGWIVDHTSCKRAMLIAYATVAIAAVIMLLATTDDAYLFVMAFSLLWLSLGAWLSIAPATTMRFFGNTHYSQNYGIVFTAYGIGAILGVLSSGLLLDFFNNINIIFATIAVLALLGSAVTAFTIE